MERIGFVGVGFMGHGMAANIMAGGYPLSVIAHRNRAPVEDLVNRGATEVASLEEMGGACDVVFICAPTSPDVEGIIAQLRATLADGSMIVDCSTSDPNSTTALAAQLAGQGIDFADAPLGGTPAQAATGELSAMVGASDEGFARIKPIIDCWAANIVHIGAVGDGHRMKLLNNFLSMGYAAIYSEALTIADKVGLDVARFDSVLRGSRMDCGFYQTFMGYNLEGNKEAHKFTISNGHKDLGYLCDMAAAARVPAGVAHAVHKDFDMAMRTGGSASDQFVPMLADYIAAESGTKLRRP